MQNRSVLLFALAVVLLAVSSCTDGVGEPPATRVETVVDTLHGTPVSDPYRWLEDDESDEVMAWVDAQNEYFHKYVDGYSSREHLRQRLEQVLSIGTIGTPEPRGDRIFYVKRDSTQNHAVLYMQVRDDGKPEVLLDPNTFSEDGTVAMDWWYLSVDGSLLAYGKSAGGSERSTLHLLRVADRSPLDDTIPNTRAADVAWLPDNSGFYYTRFATPGEVPEGDENYYRRVFFHKLGTGWQDDPLVFAPEDKTYWPGASVSPNGRHLVVSVFQGYTKTGLYYRDLTRKHSDFVEFGTGADARSSVLPLNDRMIIVTNYKAPRMRLMQADYGVPSIASWREIIPESEATVEDFVVVGDQILVRSLRNAYSRLAAYQLDGSLIEELSTPGLGTIGHLSGEVDGNRLYFSFQSYNYPTTIYRYNLADRTTEMFDQLEVGFDPSQFEVEQVWYPSKDSTPISMFVVSEKGLERDGNHPAYLTGYGGFTHSNTPYFSKTLSLWFEKGGVFAVPNLRGGGEYGEEWHEAGMLANKQNCFDDFIAAAEYLIAEGYTSREKLIISGGSNGGLLVGAALVQRPDLFKGVICAVPLLDMLRYQQFEIARLWIPEYGSAENADQFPYLYAYSPYHHVKKGVDYPAVLFMASLEDSRVHPMHAWKMAARMQAATSSGEPIFMRTEAKAGHGAGKPQSKIVQQSVETWSFVYRLLGIKW